MKYCYKCSETKPYSEFYKDKSRKDGYFLRCKDCERTLWREKRAKKPQSYAEKDRRYYVKHREEVISRRADWYKDNRFKRRAHEAVQQAIKNGDLLRKPCEACGETKVHAHHPDYSKPLTVVWLCRSHHMLLHHGK